MPPGAGGNTRQPGPRRGSAKGLYSQMVGFSATPSQGFHETQIVAAPQENGFVSHPSEALSTEGSHDWQQVVDPTAAWGPPCFEWSAALSGNLAGLLTFKAEAFTLLLSRVLPSSPKPARGHVVACGRGCEPPQTRDAIELRSKPNDSGTAAQRIWRMTLALALFPVSSLQQFPFCFSCY